VNAVLNGLSAILLVVGHACIKRGEREQHRRLMLAALFASTLFMVSYLTYHYHVGSVRFGGQGAWRVIYFAVLISHTVLAVLVPPLAIITLVRALRERFDKHKRIARWTLPIWIYVSVTGVAIYLMLYHLFGPR
jgi:uncharacterized membrane protein YozB (DUF420 family)